MSTQELSSDYIPKRFGLSYNPPQIVVEYQRPSSGKLYHHKIKFQHLTPQSKISELIDDIYKKHSTYLNHERVSKAQIIQLVEKLREKYVKISKQNSEMEEKVKCEQEGGHCENYDFDQNEDLNKLTKEELDLKKKKMDKFYEKNNIKVGDKNFQYDVRKDFNNDGLAEWDDDDF